MILLSLIVGFVCSNILISFLVHETTTDTFHTKKDKIFQLFSNDPFDDGGRIPYIPNYFGDYLTTNYPEVKDVCQLSNLEGITVEIEKNNFYDLSILSVDDSFFSLFDFPLIEGAKNNILDPGSIALSKEKAFVLFGKSEAVGRTLSIITPDTIQQLTVSAIIDKPIANSHLIFDALIHHSVLPNKWNGGASYVLMEDPGLSQRLLEKINNDKNRPGLIGLGKMDYFLSPLTESYFNMDNKLGYLKIRNPTFLKVGYVVCGSILFIAGFNFINLFLLFFQDRKKEIGIKKTLGITSKGLFGSTILEAAVYIFISFLFSLIITFLLIPIFNTVFESNLSVGFFLNIKVIASICAVLFISGISIVLFSVFKQWRMKPIRLMSKDSNKVSFNGLLFTVQFIISITLAICAVTIVQQMDHIRNAPVGFNRKIVQLDAPDQKFAEKLPVLKQKVAQLPLVRNVTVSGGNPISGYSMVRYDLEDDKFYTPFLFGGDTDFIETLGLKLTEGNLPSEVFVGKLVNQKLVRQFGMKNPIGKRVPGTQEIIIGVVKDFTIGSFKEEIPPVVISHYKDGQSLLLDYKGKAIASLLPQIRKEWSEVFPDKPFSYRIIEDELLKKHKEDILLYKIIITFSIITMILSCFGLFALSWAVVQSRTREMGIRKILGATWLDILNLLTIEFTKRILLAFLISAPVGFYLMDIWLRSFANKIGPNLWMFIIPGIIVVMIGSLTLGAQTLKATIKNPVEEIGND